MFESELTVLSLLGIFIIFSMGQNIMLGYARLPMMGFMALTAAGAYTSAILTAWYGFSFWLALPISALLGTLFGFSISWLCVRTKEDYLVIVSIGINYLVVAILTHAPYFGRMFGVVGVPPPSILGVPLKHISQFAALVWVITAVLIFLEVKLEKSPLGLALRAVGDNEATAESLGVNSLKTKVLTFMIGSAYGGVGGSLFAHFLRSVHPRYFTFEGSIEVFIMPLFGGLGTTVGSIVGALFLAALPEFLRWAYETRFVIYGILIVLLSIFQPMGLFGTDSYLTRKLTPLSAPLMARIKVLRGKLSNK